MSTRVGWHREIEKRIHIFATLKQYISTPFSRKNLIFIQSHGILKKTKSFWLIVTDRVECSHLTAKRKKRKKKKKRRKYIESISIISKAIANKCAKGSLFFLIGDFFCSPFIVEPSIPTGIKCLYDSSVCLARGQRILRVHFMDENRFAGQNPPWLLSRRIRIDSCMNIREIKATLHRARSMHAIRARVCPLLLYCLHAISFFSSIHLYPFSIHTYYNIYVHMYQCKEDFS